MVDSKIEDRSTGTTIETRNTTGVTSALRDQFNLAANSSSKSTLIEDKSRFTSTIGSTLNGASYQTPNYELGRNTAMYSSTSSSQRDGVSYSGQYETINQSQSNSYLPVSSTYNANYYQSSTTGGNVGNLSGNLQGTLQSNLQSNLSNLQSNLGNIQGSQSSSTYSTSFKSGTGYSYQSGSTTQQGGSNFSTQGYSYKKQ
jgi:hypothetical protein